MSDIAIPRPVAQVPALPASDYVAIAGGLAIAALFVNGQGARS
jgi:hypothetical protein